MAIMVTGIEIERNSYGHIQSIAVTTMHDDRPQVFRASVRGTKYDADERVLVARGLAELSAMLSIWNRNMAFMSTSDTDLEE
jgi:hypothetical protein